MDKLRMMVLLIFGLLVACAQQDQKKFSERAEAEGRGATKAEQEALIAKAQEMELDLAKRHHFYGALEGQFLGAATVGGQTYNIKFNLTRSIPPYVGQRVRQLSEIEGDLNGLFFNIQVVQWHAEDTSTAVGCLIEGIQPDRVRGLLTIVSRDCPNLYSLYLSEGSGNSPGSAKDRAQEVARKLNDREIQSVEVLTGTIQPTSNPQLIPFSVQKVKEGSR